MALLHRCDNCGLIDEAPAGWRQLIPYGKPDEPVFESPPPDFKPLLCATCYEHFYKNLGTLVEAVIEGLEG